MPSLKSKSVKQSRSPISHSGLSLQGWWSPVLYFLPPTLLQLIHLPPPPSSVCLCHLLILLNWYKISILLIYCVWKNFPFQHNRPILCFLNTNIYRHWMIYVKVKNSKMNRKLWNNTQICVSSLSRTSVIFSTWP